MHFQNGVMQTNQSSGRPFAVTKVYDRILKSFIENIKEIIGVGKDMTKYNRKFKFIKNGLSATLLTVLAVGCAATSVIEESPVSAELAPMTRPSLNLNERIVQMDKISGEEVHFNITKINDDDTHMGLSSNGCGWKSMNDLVSPALSWENCPGDPEWSSGENKNMRKKGALWPLAVGKKVSYTYDQHNARGENKGRRTRKCNVEDVVSVEVNDEQLDTFKVVCKRVQEGWWQTNVSYYSPSKGRSVRWMQTNKTDGLTRDREFLRVESP